MGKRKKKRRQTINNMNSMLPDRFCLTDYKVDEWKAFANDRNDARQKVGSLRETKRVLERTKEREKRGITTQTRTKPSERAREEEEREEKERRERAREKAKKGKRNSRGIKED